MKINITNPYYDKDYEVVQDEMYFLDALNNVKKGYCDFIHFEQTNGRSLIINPSNIASIEVLQESEE